MTDPIEAAARMPIMLPNARADDVRPTLPMSLLNEEWAQRNHSQSLTRLAQRGGLSPCEAAAIMQRRPWHRMDIGKSLAVVFSAERDSEIEALRAKLADLEAKLATAEAEVVRLREPWQPIETAPKDGVFVLITDGDVVQIGYYEDHLTAWRSDADQCRLWSDPTHWQPLPAPPERAGK